MTDVMIAVETAEPVPTPMSEEGAAKRKGVLGFGGWMSLLWLIGVTLAALFADLLPLQDPDFIDFTVDNNAPLFTPGHLLGTDETGKDILARLIYGGRTSLVVAIGVMAIGMVIGGLVGLVAGFLRGKTETIVMSVVDIVIAFPALILLIAIVSFLGQTLFWVVIGISLVSIPAFARISRATTLTFSQREFVLAARAAGAGRRRILGREVLPNVILPLLAFGLLVVGIAIVAEGSLAFLGLTSDATISWGGMINGGKKPLQQDGVIHTAMIPAMMMFFTVLAVNFLGDRFRAAFDVKDAAL